MTADDKADSDTVQFDVPRSVLGIHAMCDEEAARHALGNVRIESDGSQVSAVATDGRMMAIAQWPDGKQGCRHGTPKRHRVEAIGGPKAEALVPSSLFSRMVGIFDGDSWTESFTVTVTHVGVECVHIENKPHPRRPDRVMLEKEVQSGRFPKWQDVLPGDRREVVVVVDARRMIAAMELLGGISDSDHNSVKLRIPYDDGPVLMVAKNEKVEGTVILMPLADDSA